jgi:hypothetical protein
VPARPSGGGNAYDPNYSFMWGWKVCIIAKFWPYHWEGCMWNKQCNMELGYQLSICSRAEEYHRKPRSSSSPVLNQQQPV